MNTRTRGVAAPYIETPKERTVATQSVSDPGRGLLFQLVLEKRRRMPYGVAA